MMILLLFLLIGSSSSKHIRGTWQGHDLKTFVVKFAFETFQQQSTGYVYGNVTADGDIQETLTLLLINQTFEDDFRDGSSCSEMFSNVKHVAYDERCNKDGPNDMLRAVPCQENGVCGNKYGDIIPGYQLTFKVDYHVEQMYWYIVFASCNHGKIEDCNWYSSNQHISLHYDIWLVNGFPGNDTNFFTHQLSVDQQTLPQIFITFTSLYILLNLVHFSVQKVPKHPVILVQSICVFLQCAAVTFGCVHHLLYAADGVGQPILRECGRWLDDVVQCLFVLLLLLLARGWRITRVDIRQKHLLFIVWTGYSLVYLTSVLLSILVGDPLSNQTYYQPWWGIAVFSIRVIIVFWFFFELRATYQQENDKNKLSFYKVFGVLYCLWFLYLPVAVIIASQISPFIRAKTLIGLELSADFISLCSMCILLLPPFRHKYFTISSHLDTEATTMIQKQYRISYESLSDASKSLGRNRSATDGLG